MDLAAWGPGHARALGSLLGRRSLLMVMVPLPLLHRSCRRRSMKSQSRLGAFTQRGGGMTMAVWPTTLTGVPGRAHNAHHQQQNNRTTVPCRHRTRWPRCDSMGRTRGGGGGSPTHARTSFLRTRQQVWWRRRTLGVTLCPLPLPPSLPFISLVGKIKDPHRTFDLLLQHVDLDRLGETGDSILHRLQLLRQFLLNLQQVLLRLHHIYPVPLRQLDLDTRIYAGDSVRTPLNDAVSEGGGGAASEWAGEWGA